MVLGMGAQADWQPLHNFRQLPVRWANRAHPPAGAVQTRARAQARAVVTKRLGLMEVVHKLPNSLATSYNTSIILSIISISRESGACASAHPTCPGPFKPARARAGEGGRHKAPGAVRGGAGVLKQLGYLIQHF